MKKENTNPAIQNPASQPEQAQTSGQAEQGTVNQITNKKESKGSIAKASKPSKAKGEKNMKATNKQASKPAASKGAKTVKAAGTKTSKAKNNKPAMASINEAGTHFELLVPAIKNNGKVGEWEVKATNEEKKLLRIDTKTVNKEQMLIDVQRAILETMRTKAQAEVNKLKASKKAKPTEFTELDQLKLDKQESLLKCLDTQRKKYTASKYNGRANLAGAIITGTKLNIEVKPMVTLIRASWESILEVLDAYHDNKPVENITPEQQTCFTDIKKVIIGIASPYCAKVTNDAGEVICEEFKMTLSNKDIIKLLMSLYEFYKRTSSGDMKDGLKLDGKEETLLKWRVMNLIYARMTGAK